MKSTLHPDWDSDRETRSILLRFVAFSILVANLVLGSNEGALTTHFVVVVAHLGINVTSVATTWFLPRNSWLNTLFVVLDALLVALLL